MPLRPSPLRPSPLGHGLLGQAGRPAAGLADCLLARARIKHVVAACVRKVGLW